MEDSIALSENTPPHGLQWEGSGFLEATPKILASLKAGSVHHRF